MGLAAVERPDVDDIERVLVALERAREDAETAIASMRAAGVTPHVIEAVEFTRTEIGAAAKRLQQRTLAISR